MATAALSTKAVGTKITLNVDSKPRQFIIVQQNKPSALYDDSCNGTWVLMEDIYESQTWNSAYNNYGKSTINTYLNNTWLKKLDANIQNAIKSVKIPYCTGYSDYAIKAGANGLTTKAFLLSGYEMGWTTSTGPYFPVDGAKLAYFESGTGTSANNKRVAKLNGSASYWWLRSPGTNINGYAWLVNSDGMYSSSYVNNRNGVRPAFVLPSNLLVSDDGSVSTNTAPKAPATITVPGSISGGTKITVSWAVASDTENNVSGYELDVSTNASQSWNNIYKGTLTSTTYDVVFGTPSVTFRVRAYDAGGLYSPYKLSNQVNVVNNVAPGAPAGITVPAEVKGGQPLTITWNAAVDTDNNLKCYELDRKYNGESYAKIYTTPNNSTLTYTDSITKGKTTVQYRVRAVDTLSVAGPYKESVVRNIDNNVAPVIVVDGKSNNANLGEFTDTAPSIAYTVTDENSDSVTVTVTLDSTQLSSGAASLGQKQTLTWAAAEWQKILNGTHTINIAARDAKVTTNFKLTFTKTVKKATITLKNPMKAASEITMAALSVTGSIPSDATYKVEVTNEADKAGSATWQNVTEEVKQGRNIIFTKHSDDTKSFNFRITVERGASNAAGYIQSVQGGFQ